VPITVSVPVNRPAVTEVDFYADNQLIGTDTAAPYTATWDATKVYNGSHVLLVIAKTTRTDITGSQSQTFSVTGGLTPPAISVSITAPQDGATVFGNIPITASISSTIAISEVDFYANGQTLGAAKIAPYTVTWNATQAVPGSYSITATALSTTGGSAGGSISVNVIAPPLFSPGERVKVQTDSNIGLNVRSGPAATYSIIGTEPNGTFGTVANLIPVVASGYNWWQVKYSDGITGWSAEAYLTAAP